MLVLSQGQWRSSHFTVRESVTRERTCKARLPLQTRKNRSMGSSLCCLKRRTSLLVQTLEGSFFFFFLVSNFFLYSHWDRITQTFISQRNKISQEKQISSLVDVDCVISFLMKLFRIATNTNGWYWLVVVCCEACDWNRETLLFWNCITQSTNNI